MDWETRYDGRAPDIYYENGFRCGTRHIDKQAKYIRSVIITKRSRGELELHSLTDYLKKMVTMR